MKLYYVLEMREEHESCSPLYITSNKEKAIKWFSLNTDESLRYFIACKEQQWDDVYLKCNLDDSERKNNYFAGLWQYIKSMDFQEFMDKHGTEYIDGPEPEIIDLDELHKDDNPYGIKYFN